MKILVTMPNDHIRATFIPPDTAAKLEALGEVVWNDSDRQWSPEEVRDRLPGVDVCITGWGSCTYDEAVLAGADRLKLIAHTGGSVAGIVSEAFFDRGLRVISGNWLYAESVAEGTIAYILASLRNIPHYNSLVHAGGWRDAAASNEGLLDQTVGLVEFGMVAKNLAMMFKPFRVRLKVYSRFADAATLREYGAEPAELEEIFTTCKIISVHAALTPETRHMIDRRLLRMIPEGAVLINTARGSVIDEQALAEELATGRFKAVLDVFEVEPLPQDSKLRGLPNVILIPHMAGPTVDRRPRVTEALIEDIRRFERGEALQYEISRAHAMYMTR
jgi:phosphoglycerate dehydrogenase-like enzyme